MFAGHSKQERIGIGGERQFRNGSSYAMGDEDMRITLLKSWAQKETKTRQ